MTLDERVIKLEAMIEVILGMQCQILAKLDGRESEEIHKNAVKGIQEIFDEYISEPDNPG